MGLAILLIFAVAVIMVVLRYLNISTKVTSFTVLFIALIFTIGVCITKPQMHKPFSIDIIDYIVKINDDGSTTMTKQTTRTVIQKKVPK